MSSCCTAYVALWIVTASMANGRRGSFVVVKQPRVPLDGAAEIVRQ